MEDLAPDITRQRLLLEGFYEADVDEASIRGYFDHVASTLGLRTYGEPTIYSPSGTGRDENQGFDAFQPLIDSGISLYVWTARRFLAAVVFTCRSFDADAARQATVDYFAMPRVVSQPF
jgi:S-adenosylmethionine decarboxylase